MHGEDLLQKVDVLSGTNSTFGFSTGNTLPITAYPFGGVHWSPETADGSWFFHPQHKKFRGFRATHQPSPWIGDYGQLCIMPIGGEVRRLDGDGRASSYHRSLQPEFALVHLSRYDLTATLFPKRTGAQMVIESFRDQEVRLVLEHADAVHQESPTEVHVVCRRQSGGTPSNFGVYYVLLFTEAVELYDHPRALYSILLGQNASSVVEIGHSFISFAQARQNIRNDRKQSAKTAWLEIFNRFQIEDDDKDAIGIFANALHRAHLFPRESHEFDADGNPVHFSFFDGQVYPGTAVTDNGFWDTYRTVYPWFNLTRPSRSALCLNGWNAALAEGGWFPQWASPGYRACMVGTHIDSVFADAVAKGVQGFDVALALRGMKKHAEERGDAAGAYGRLGITDYLKQGFVSEETVEGSVSRSLDYAYNDFCIATVSKALGEEHDEYARFNDRASNYKKLFDPEVGFFRARHSDGSWAEFGEFVWGGPYVEGGPWQSNWAVPHDPEGLIELHGGPVPFVAKLERLIQNSTDYEVGPYGFEIHEMTEMAQANFGQYAHSNQPVHHALYLFALAGRLDLTQKYVGYVTERMYTSSSLPGDEDNGEMSCWYLFSALGFYPFCPGKPEYVLGIPRFRRVKMTFESGVTVIVEKEPGATGLPLINGVLAESVIIPHSLFASDVTLTWVKR